MTYRDDEAARRARIEALERQAARATALEARVAELEADNRALRARLAALEPEPEPAPDERPLYVDGKLAEYVAALVGAAGAPGDRVQTIVAAAAERARAADRAYLLPADIKEAIRAGGLLGERGDEALDTVEVP